MEGIVIQPVRVVGWSPAPHRVPEYRPALAQAPQPALAPPPAPAPAPIAPPKPPFIDSALVSTMIDVLGAISTGTLAYIAAHPAPVTPGGPAPRASKWSYFWGILSGVLVFKGIADLSRIRTR
jgi:hypothetical protein